MKKIIKTEDVANVFELLGSASLAKMADDEKLAVFKICRQMKPVATKYNEELVDAKKTLAPYDNFFDDLKKAYQFQVARENGKEYNDYTEQEYKNFLKDFVKYNELVAKATKELKEKEVELEMPDVTEDLFDKLCFANNWTFDVREKFNVLTE